MATARVRVAPDTRKGRSGKSDPSSNYINNGSTADSTALLRVQRLAAFGVVDPCASIIATLVWGGLPND